MLKRKINESNIGGFVGGTGNPVVIQPIQLSQRSGRANTKGRFTIGDTRAHYAILRRIPAAYEANLFWKSLRRVSQRKVMHRRKFGSWSRAFCSHHTNRHKTLHSFKRLDFLSEIEGADIVLTIVRLIVLVIFIRMFTNSAFRMY